MRHIILIASLTLLACSSLHRAEQAKPEFLNLVSLFPSDVKALVTFDASIIASSVLDVSQGKPRIIVPVSNGVIAALDAETGALEWKINAPAPDGQQVQLISTPVVIGDRLVILYQCLEKSVRTSHRLAVIDLAKNQLDASFPVLVLAAEKPAADGVSTVKFNPPTAFSHAELKHILKPGATLGTVYAAFGNSGDEQPFHGWMFEIDLDAWRTQGIKQAISSVLLTTPESKCPVTMDYGTQEMICGGGIWAPSGPQIAVSGDDVDIFVATGNGQVDIARRDYANAVIRLKPGLQFEAGCNAQLCQNFNPVNPDEACISSCKNLFIPRLAEGNKPLRSFNGECDKKTFWECLAWLDYDLGGSTPVKVALQNGRSVLVQPGKDGAVYLIDAEHLGTQYDRLQIAELCGTPTDGCARTWMGMIVTEPVQAVIDQEPVVVVPTYMPDKTHPAGLVALKIVLEKGLPKFKHFWQFPDAASPEAVQSFRSHPSLPAMTTLGKNADPVVWIVDIGSHGTLYGVRMKDGVLVARQTLKGAGRQLSRPLIYGNNLYLASIMPDTGKAFIEAYRIELVE
ncbi:MAG: PQQ-binding-like beta-propeller repeat protein [Methylococcaceae bacterium]